MTTSARSVLAIVALVAGVCLIALGSITHDAGAAAPGGAMVTLVLGYAFGDRNGEKRLAAALNVLQAETVQPGSTAQPADATPPAAVPPAVVETPATIVTTTEVKPTTPARKARTKKPVTT